MKKLILLLIFIITLKLAYAADITIGPPQNNGLITIPININSESDIAGVQITIEYNTNEFEFQDAEFGDITNGMTDIASNLNGVYIVGLFTLDDKTYIKKGSGNLLNLKIKPLGNYNLNNLKFSFELIDPLTKIIDINTEYKFSKQTTSTQSSSTSTSSNEESSGSSSSGSSSSKTSSSSTKKSTEDNKDTTDKETQQGTNNKNNNLLETVTGSAVSNLNQIGKPSNTFKILFWITSILIITVLILGIVAKIRSK